MEKTDKRLLEIFTELIKIDAVSGSELPVNNYIREFFKKLNIDSYSDNAFEATK